MKSEICTTFPRNRKVVLTIDVVGIKYEKLMYSNSFSVNARGKHYLIQGLFLVY